MSRSPLDPLVLQAAPFCGAWLCVLPTMRHDAEGLALWAMRYSPLVSICRRSSGVVADVAASAHLFGGLDALLDDARRQLRTLGIAASVAGAPTASAARVLAANGGTARWVGHDAWPARLRQLRLEQLGLERADLALLRALGLRSAGDCLVLNGGDLDRRCREAVSLRLARLTGSAADPQIWFTPPPRFDRRLELLSETWQAGALRFGLERLLAELEGLLRGRSAATDAIDIRLGHAPGRPDTCFSLRTTRPSQSSAMLRMLLRERLEQLKLPGPVRSVGLQAALLVDWQARAGTLWPTPDDTAYDRASLLDRLRARLGETAIYSLDTVPDHRPEHAWRRTHGGAGAPPRPAPDTAIMRKGTSDNSPGPNPRSGLGRGSSPCRGLRPLWLLDAPQALATIGGDWVEERGPERIEAGWWATPLARDYYVLRDTQGRRLWAFRSTRGDWFAQGWFA